MKQKIMAVLALVLLPAFACQAAWMRQGGEVSAMAGFSLSYTGNIFDREGNRFKNTCGTSSNIPMLVEYGASYYRTYFLGTSYSSYNCGAGQMEGFNDIDVGMRGRLNLFANDQTWELAAIIPSYVDPNGAALQPKHFGIRVGWNSSDRIDTYQGFSAGEISSPNTYSYGIGVKAWTGHIPNELSGYLAWGHVLSDSVWAEGVGGWFFSARLDGLQSFGKEHNVNPGPGLPVAGLHDQHDRFSLLTGSVAAWQNLSPRSGIQYSVNRGLWGRNVGSPLGIHISYSRTWRD